MNLSMAAALLLLIVSVASGVYAFAEGQGRSKSISWSVFIVSTVALAAFLLMHYLRFVLRELPMMG